MESIVEITISALPFFGVLAIWVYGVIGFIGLYFADRFLRGEV